MADVSKISLYGTSYNIKDSTARTSASTANATATSAKTTADSAASTAASNTTKITKLAGDSVVIEYASETETISVTKGITVS